MTDHRPETIDPEGRSGMWEVRSEFRYAPLILILIECFLFTTLHLDWAWAEKRGPSWLRPKPTDPIALRNAVKDGSGKSADRFAGEPARLNLTQAGALLEMDLLELHEKVDDLASLLQMLAYALKKKGKLPFSTDWLSALKREEKEMEVLARRVDAVQSFVGFTDEESRKPLDAFLSNLMRKHQADKVILWVESLKHYLAYSRGFTQEELEIFTEHRDELLRLHHPSAREPYRIQHAKEMLSQLGVASLMRSHPIVKRWKPLTPLFLSVVLGRNSETVKRIRMFEHEDTIHMEKTFRRSLEEDSALWRVIDLQISRGDYRNFGILMRTIRHNSVTHWWKRNHIAVLRGFIEELKGITKGKPIAKDLANRLIDEAKSVEGTVSKNDVYVQLLEEGEKFETLNVVPVMREAVDTALRKNRDEIRRKGLRVRTHMAPSQQLLAVVDQKLLKVIVENLIDNAVKYNKRRGKIVIQLSHKDFKETRDLHDKVQRTPQESVLLEVSDTGIGVPKGDFIRIFARGGRGSNVGTRQGDGEGLDIVHMYTHVMQGEILLQSELGEGSTFKLYLPEVKETAETVQTSQDGGKHKDKLQDGFEFRETSRVVIRDPRERILLLQKSSSSSQAGLWELPGGKAEVGEAPENVGGRESWEEIRKKLHSIRSLGVVVPDFQTSGGPRRIWGIEARTNDPSAVKINPKTHRRFLWVPVSKLHKMQLTESSRLVLERVLGISLQEPAKKGKRAKDGSRRDIELERLPQKFFLSPHELLTEQSI